jgi:ATP phosphoribosyltransferase
VVATAAENITKKIQFITFRKKVFMVYFKVLSEHLPEVTELTPASNGM